MVGLPNPVRMFRALIEATPPGAVRPTSVVQWRPPLPAITWWPSSGELETHWDWQLQDALSLPGVWRARMLISQAIGAMPIAQWVGTTQVTPPSEALLNPHPRENRAETVAAWVCDLLDHGNAFGVYGARYATGFPSSVQPIPATRVKVSPDGTLYEIHDDQGQPVAVYTRDQVFHAKGTHRPGDARGMGVLEAGLGALTRMSSEADYAARAFTSGTPAGLLRVKDPDLQAGTPDDPAGFVTATGIKKAWQASIATGDIAVMSELVDFQPLAWTPSDAQMVEARGMSLVDTANLYNLDPYWVGAPQASSPYQNVQQSALSLSRFTLGFWITSLEAEFSRMIPRGNDARFNRDSILRDDTVTRAQIQTQYLAAGVLTVDEVRAAEGLPPMPESDPTQVTPPVQIVREARA